MFLVTVIKKIASALGRVFAILGYFQSRHPRRYSPRQWRRRRNGAMALLLLLIGINGSLWYYSRDKRVLSYAIVALQKVTGGEVELKHASIVVLREIRIKGLKIYLPERPHIEKNLVFQAKDVIIQHEPLSFLEKKLRLKKIVAYEPQLNIW